MGTLTTGSHTRSFPVRRPAWVSIFGPVACLSTRQEVWQASCQSEFDCGSPCASHVSHPSVSLSMLCDLSPWRSSTLFASQQSVFVFSVCLCAELRGATRSFQ